MSVFFALILFASCGILVFTDPAGILPAMIGGAGAGLAFMVRLFAIYAIWLSVLRVLEKSGADRGIARILNPVSRLLFKNESDNTYKYINLNMSANLLGMGGAATPMGIKATETMRSKKNKIMLVVINSVGIQLIPTTVIALRAEHGGVADIIIPCLIANAATTLIAVLLVKVFVRGGGEK